MDNLFRHTATEPAPVGHPDSSRDTRWDELKFDRYGTGSVELLPRIRKILLSSLNNRNVSQLSVGTQRRKFISS